MKLTLAEELTASEPIVAWRRELDAMYDVMHSFESMELDEIIMHLAASSSRLSEIRSLLVRLNTRAANNFRTQEIDYALAEVDRQFKMWSRVMTFRGQEIQMLGKVT